MPIDIRVRRTGRIPGPRALRAALGALLLGVVLGGPPPVSAQSAVDGRDGIEPCAAGVVGRIDVESRPVFPVDPDDPRALRWAMEAANFVHVETAESFIRDELLLEEGDCYDPFLVSQSRRLLEEYTFIDQVRMETSGEAPGERVLTVRTRDRWSTQVDVGVTYDAGLNLEKFQATELNLLGRGVTAEVTYRERRETEEKSFRLFTPRFFGTTDADLRAGRTRAGSFFFQRLNHGLVQEATRFSASELFDRRTEFYSYGTGGSEPFSHLLVPMYRERAELALGVRLGRPGASWIVGTSLERSVHRRDGHPELVRSDRFDEAEPGDVRLPGPVRRQTVDRAATRLAVHLGVRRVGYEERVGLDAMSERQLVELGYEGSVSVGRSLGLLVPDDLTPAADTYGRFFSSATVSLGPAIVRLTATGEGAWAHGGWRDLLAQSDVATWVQGSWLPGQTLFLQAAAAGGWRTTLPFQLALGGREGVRSMVEDEAPGGRRLYLLAEDRIRFPWPEWDGLEVGGTVFADAGRMWRGDAPYGRDSGWRGSVGFGLRFASPEGSRQVLRPEIAFPVGHDGSPVFRVTAEIYPVGRHYGTPGFIESRRFLRGAESY